MDKVNTKSTAAETKSSENDTAPVNPVSESVKNPPAVTLSPAVEQAIAAAIQAALAPVLDILTKPATAAPAPAPEAHPGVVNAVEPSPRFKLVGIPVAEGQDLRHVHPQTIKNWFGSVEQRWKEIHNAKKVGGANVNMNWTRG